MEKPRRSTLTAIRRWWWLGLAGAVGLPAGCTVEHRDAGPRPGTSPSATISSTAVQTATSASTSTSTGTSPCEPPPTTTATTATSSGASGGVTGTADLSARDYGAPGKFAWLYFMSGWESCKSLAVDGACRVEECVVEGAKPSFGSLDGGTVTVASVSGMQTATWQYGLDGGPNAYSYPSIDFLKAGELITFTVEGNVDSGVPAFSASITLPAPTTLAQPTAAVKTIDASQPLSVAWTGGEGQQLLEIGGCGVVARCAWPAALQKATVSTAILGALGKGASYVYLSNGKMESKLISGWDVRLSALHVNLSHEVTIQ